MHFSGYLSGVLFGLPFLLSISAYSIDTSKTDALGSLLNRLLPRGDDGQERPSRSGNSKTPTSNPPPEYVSFSYTPRRASVFSSGGGASETLSNSRFPGRRAGGYKRREVYGMRRCGLWSRGTDAPVSMENVGFDFGFWPIWFPDGYCGTSRYEYPSLTLNDTRPGGEMVVVDLQPDSTQIQLSAEETNHTYYMYGDKDSVVLMMNILVLPRDQGGCNTLNNSLVNWTLSTATEDRLDPGHALQWYRSSSFVLAYTGYNNSYAYPPLNTTSAVNMSDPLPSALLTSEYLFCLIKTIGDALPIMDANDASLSAGQIARIGGVIGGLFGALAIAMCYVCYGYGQCCSCCYRSRKRKNTKTKIGPTSQRRLSEGDRTSIHLRSYGPSDSRSPLAPTPSLSPTLKTTPTPVPTALGRPPRSLLSDSNESGGGASGVPRSPVGPRYNGLPLSPYVSDVDMASRQSVSSKSSQESSPPPLVYNDDSPLLKLMRSMVLRRT